MHDLPVEALDYDLPERLIARWPADPRDTARLLVVHRDSGTLEHRTVRDLPQYMHADDLVVFNNTAVFPARIAARRTDTGGRVEGLYLHDLPAGQWQMMLKSNGKLRPGQSIELLDADDQPSGIVVELQRRIDSQWAVRVESDQQPQQVLQRVGRTPLPPYILRARTHSSDDDPIVDAVDRVWYQTVYADPQLAGSVAAPTAGLHFTENLLAELDARGVERRYVTLHVGAGTFKPIDEPTLWQHIMHREHYDVSPEVCKSLKQATSERRRILAIGTTTVRTLESLPSPLSDPDLRITSQTDLCIAPGYQFKLVNAMMTNFHLPRSTLLALVAAFIGLDWLLDIYRQAIEREYHFYSYGDAMLILP